MAELSEVSPSFIRRFWSLSVTFMLMVSMIFMVRFGFSVMAENRKIFLDAALLHIGQTPQEVASVMGTPDHITTSDDFICYCYGEKQKNVGDFLNWVERIYNSSTNSKRYSSWPVIIRFDHETGKAVRLKKGTLTID